MVAAEKERQVTLSERLAVSMRGLCEPVWTSICVGEWEPACLRPCERAYVLCVL